MPFYYTGAASTTTSATAATQTLAAALRTGTAVGASITRMVVGATGTAQDNPCLWQAWRPTAASTAGTAQAAVPHDALAPAAGTSFVLAPTVGTKGANPVLQLPFNSRAMVQWVALTADEALRLTAGGAANGEMDFYDAQGAGVAVTLGFQITWSE